MNRPRLFVVALFTELAFAGYGCGSVTSRQPTDGGQAGAASAGTTTVGQGGVGGTAGHGGATGSSTGGAGGMPLGTGGGGRGGGAGQAGAAGSGAGAAGGVAGSGAAGASGTGGIVGTGGIIGTGGVVSTGGIVGTGGVTSTGGIVGTGGITSTGGIVGTGGVTSTGGIVGTGGITSTGGAGGMTCGFAMPNPASASLPNPASYDTSTSGVVLDKVTGLAWERTLSSSSYDQSGAAAYCSSNRLGGWSDWRLPSILELGTVMDFTQDQTDPRIDPVTFPNTPNDNTRASWFQTSTAVAGDATKSWYVDFQNGNNFVSTKGTGRVRCVRVAEVVTSRCFAAGARFVASTTGGISTKLDSATGLVWQLGVGPQLVDWSDAVSYCQGLSGNFRLPSIKEMQTIIDYTVASPGPTINAAFPPAHPASYYYWASTPLSGVSTGAWLMAVDTGSLTWNGQDALYLARCVH